MQELTPRAIPAPRALPDWLVSFPTIRREGDVALAIRALVAGSKRGLKRPLPIAMHVFMQRLLAVPA